MRREQTGYVVDKKTGKIVYQGSMKTCIELAMDNDKLIVSVRKPQQNTGDPM